MDEDGSLHFAVFRGTFQVAGPAEPFGDWAVTHAFSVDQGFPIEDTLNAVRGFFSLRWLATIPGQGSFISEQARWREVKVVKVISGAVAEDNSLNVAGPGHIDTVGMLPAQVSLLLTARTAVIGFSGRLYLPGISRGFQHPGEPSFDWAPYPTLFKDWYQPAVIAGINVQPVVWSPAEAVYFPPTAVVVSRWPRTQRRRTRGEPDPYVVLEPLL